MTAPMTPGDFQAFSGVSRETMDRLAIYLDLLGRWNPGLGLAGTRTMTDPWRRHILDSFAVWPLIPRQAEIFLDLGSGGGCPGLVLAACGAKHMHLVESNGKKAFFLELAAREMGLAVTIHNIRIEQLTPFSADIITARALAPLPHLLGLAARFWASHTTGLFHKGQGLTWELTGSSRLWKMKTGILDNPSDHRGKILVTRKLRRA